MRERRAKAKEMGGNAQPKSRIPEPPTSKICPIDGRVFRRAGAGAFEGVKLTSAASRPSYRCSGMTMSPRWWKIRRA